MATIQNIYDYIDQLAPFDTAMDFDNAGLLVGDGAVSPQKVMLSLDITKGAVTQAKLKGAKLIISHHPVIFQPIKNVLADSIPFLLIKKGIGAICAHTNLDMAPGGVNDSLAMALGLSEVEPISYYKECPCCVMGNLSKEFEPKEFAAYVKRLLGCEGVRFVPGNRNVRSVALCSGAGGDYLFDAMANGADAFVTGEVKHHEILAARACGLTLVDAGHFKTETVVLEPLRQKLQGKFPEVEFFLEENATDGVHYQ